MSAVAINCGHVIHELWDWLDGEMEAGRLEAIRQHLAVCRGCESHVAYARTFLEHVKEPPRSTDDLDALRARLRDALRNERT